jgi:hypothetical protein
VAELYGKWSRAYQQNPQKLVNQLCQTEQSLIKSYFFIDLDKYKRYGQYQVLLHSFSLAGWHLLPAGRRLH